ncbi:MAG TPA: type II toxin-antitoxin system VapC family toxin [Chromatiales bacterium]|nr:type II toxin-antitoxin system VapC family toxin [Chromatiales bacterium]
MRTGLDTSVVLRLLIGEPADQADRAWRFILQERSEGREIVVSDLVISEAYFALQYHYDVPKGEALQQLGRLVDSGQIVANGCAAAVLRIPRLASAKPGFVDRLIHEGYMCDADRVATFELAAKKLQRSIVLPP